MTELSKHLDFKLKKDGFHLTVVNRKGPLEIKKTKEKGTIYFEKPIHFYRALGLFLEKEKHVSFEIEENPQFDTTGAMLDQSRNAVLTVNYIKYIVRKIALMGMNMLLLYTEDTYEIDNYPYFGYMRGRYSKKELKEIDDYAFNLGVEVVPCIQTLAHLKQTLKWNYTSDFRDTNDILLVDHPETYSFIEEMIKSVSETFRSERVHIGMDEAFQLGRGKYLEKNGYEERFDIMNRHLNKVVEITDRFNLKSMMWSDMYFRIGSETGYYYDRDIEIPEDVIQSIPKSVEMVYWDYYHDDKDFYSDFINKHKKLGTDPVFAGGAWTWNGISPNYGKALTTSEPALIACKEEGVREVFVTVWGDNGAETPQITALPILNLYAEHAYNEEVNEETLKQRFQFINNCDLEDFLLLNYLDETPGVSENNPECSSPSKLLLYQDILLGLYDKNIAGLELNSHYEKLTKKINTSVNKSNDFQLLFTFYAELASVLSIKSELGIKLKSAYDNENSKELQDYVTIIEEVIKRTTKLKDIHQELWLTMYKPFGWEVIDIRYGGVLSRLTSAAKRIESYLNGDIEAIEELKEERLHFEGPYPMPKDVIGRNNYHQIVTANDLG